MMFHQIIVGIPTMASCNKLWKFLPQNNRLTFCNFYYLKNLLSYFEFLYERVAGTGFEPVAFR